MEFAVLGTLAVTTATGEKIALPSAKQRILLATLLSRAGAVVSQADLVTALWSDPPSSARANVRLYVHRLRRTLGAPDRIEYRDHGYLLAVREGELDAERFAALGARGTRERDPHRAAELLRQALALWRGPAYGELATLPGIGEAAERLEEERLRVLELRVQADLELGRHAELVGELRHLVRAHPFREGLHAHLMRALYGSARQSEALESFRQARALLSRELGVEPGPELRALHQQLLRGDAGLAAHRPAAVPRELPPGVHGFTGRERELAALDAMLPDGLGVLAGSAGVGKTSLAVRWAHRVAERFPDGQLFLDLRGYSPESPLRPIDALSALLRSLGVPPDRVPDDVTAAAARFRTLVAGRRLLFVLDNARSAEQVRPLLPGTGSCMTLITSRAQLTGLVAREGAHRLGLDVLTPSEAEDLLRRLLGDRVTAEQEAARLLAGACARLPLALRIAAATLADRPHQPIAAYLRELADPLEALTTEGDEEHGLRAAFELSYRALPSCTQELFRVLGLVPCADFGQDAIGALMGAPDRDLPKGLRVLLTANLVVEHAPGRYTLHDLLRHYARELAEREDPPDVRQAARTRLLVWYLSMVTAASELIYPDDLRLPVPEEMLVRVPPMDAEQAVRWLTVERTNLITATRHAARYGPRAAAWLLVDALRGYQEHRKHLVGWLSAARAGLVAARVEGDERAQATAYQALAHAHFDRSRYDRVLVYLGRAAELAHAAGWLRGESSVRNNLGVTLHALGRGEEAITHLSAAYAINLELGWLRGQAGNQNNLANAYLICGRLEEAVAAARLSVALFTEIGAPNVSHALSTLGECLHQSGQYGEAHDLLSDALARSRDNGNLTRVAGNLAWLAVLHHDTGQLEAALACAREAAELGEGLTDAKTKLETINALGTVLTAAGDHRGALAAFHRSLDLAARTGAAYWSAEARLGVAITLEAAGRRQEAVQAALLAVSEAELGGFRLVRDRALAVTRSQKKS